MIGRSGMLALIGQPSSRSSSSPAANAAADATVAPKPPVDGATANADAVLTVDDVAALTRVGRNTIYSLVARNQIPHRRMGKQIRFSRAAVMSWLATSWQGAKEGK